MTASRNVLFLDDAEEVRDTVSDYLCEGGYGVVQTATAEATLEALKAEQYFAFLLDIDLGPEASGIGEILDTYHRLFPDVAFAHESALMDLGLSRDSTVNGKVLLPMIKTVAPLAEVIMLTGTYHDGEQEQFMRKWGARVTIQKLAEDETFFAEDPVPGLEEELLGYLDDIRQEQL